MATPERNDLPPYIGLEVRVLSKRTRGTVINFDEEKQKFMVETKVDDVENTVKLEFHSGCDLAPIELAPFTFERLSPILMKVMANLDNPNKIENMEEMLSLFAQFKNPFGREEITLRNKWFNLLIRAPRTRKLLKKLEREIEKFLIDIPFEEMKVVVKMSLVGVKNALGKEAEVQKIYQSCFENHFGFLPLILTNFFQICPFHQKPVQEENIALFQKVKVVMESKNYIFSTDVDGFYAGMYAWFSGAGLMVFKLVGDRSMQHPITQEILYIREKINILNLKNVHNNLAEARFMSLLGGKDEEALELLNRYQNELTKLIGPESNRFAYIFELKIILYVQLGNRKMANQALKKYSKYMPGEQKLYKTFIDDHVEQCEKLQTKKPEFKKLKMKKKCSNPKCGAQESKPGEYLACAKCRKAVYCSRNCQRKHWKIHKQFCKKKSKKQGYQY